MKAESTSTQDPVAAAAQALAQAMADAQRAIHAARSQNSPEKVALAAALKETRTLRAKISTLEASSRLQTEDIERLHLRCEVLAMEREVAEVEKEAKDRRIGEMVARLGAMETRLVAAETALRRERAAALQERAGLESIVAREEALKADKLRLGRERTKLTKEQQAARSDRRATVGALKRSVDALQTQIDQHERALADIDRSDDEEPTARGTKRRRTEEGAQPSHHAGRSHEEPRRGRRAHKPTSA
ncbi:hypothetical protein B0H11DRAFT_1974707 [Mycena galericulata]|nr:hypothetical protein B0H11DRAFT_1974707 [Mycena galericulata]